MQLQAVLERTELALADEPVADRTVLLARLERYWPDLVGGLAVAYGAAATDLAPRLVELAVEGFRARPHDLRMLDLRRHVQPDWFQSPRMLGYAAYADRFGGDLAGVASRVPYLAELGVTYLHLMPLLRPRPAPNDGGYAVEDFRSVRPDLGTMADLTALAAVLRRSGISLTLDLVLNHVAAEHEWARRAREGESRYRAYFHVFPDRTVPDLFEATLPEVFPDTSPGSFSAVPELGWVWTTFHSYQWDLDWSNPDVLLEFAELVCLLANAGVECLRLDAIAFLWKRMGTDSQNQPEVHGLTQALRAVGRIAAPAMLFKAEAIVGPAQLARYLGTGVHSGRVSELAYHNSLMVQVWSALAARDARLLTTALRRFAATPPSTSWATYVRGHDDIGWAVDDADAAEVGWDGPAHRAFLSDFYSGAFPGSFARGLVFQENERTGDRRISGSAASLAGLESAGDDPELVDLAVRRLLLAHLVVLGHGGLPVLWMGDELALLNDASWAQDPAHADDNRWVHRPRMPWDVAERRHAEGTVEHRVWHGLREAVRARAGMPAMHAAVQAQLLDPVNPAVVSWVRRSPEQTVVAVHNLTEHTQVWPRWAVPLDGPLTDVLTGRTGSDDPLVLEAYEVRWLVPA